MQILKGLNLRNANEKNLFENLNYFLQTKYFVFYENSPTEKDENTILQELFSYNNDSLYKKLKINNNLIKIMQE